MKTAFLLVSALLAASSAALPAQIAAADRSPVREGAADGSHALFAVIYRQGPKWKKGVPMAGQALGAHLSYYRRGADEGRVFAAGGLMAINGGLAILRMTNLDEARKFMAADPAVLNGTLVGEVNAWSVPIAVRGDLIP